MTGVAGKSKGCTTCRRRKIKCDLALPACRNCSRFGRKCEGYERYPVFINRTSNGVAIRKPLEEAKSSSCASQHLGSQVKEPLPLVTRVNNAGPSLRSRKAEANCYVSWFWDSFAPAGSSRGAKKKQTTHWLYHVLSVNPQHPALDEALLALSLTRYGKVHSDRTVLEKGQQIYVQALGLLQQCLYDEKLALLDETLATVSVMALHEILETTSKSPEGWSKHVDGFASLLQHRGPQNHRALLPRKLFEHSRYMLMLQTIKRRKSSAFGTQVWREDPWTGADKDMEQKIFDYGLKVGGLLETTDTFFRNDACLDFVENLLEELAEIVTNISVLQEQSSVLTLDTPTASSQRYGNRQPATSPDYALTSPQIITAFGLQLIACVTGYTVALKTIDLETTTSPSNIVNTTHLTMQNYRDWFNARRVRLAQAIHKSTISYLKGGVGMRGASRAIFPLRLAFEQFETATTEYAECKDLLQKLEGAGVEFVPSLHRNEAIASRIIRRRSLLHG